MTRLPSITLSALSIIVYVLLVSSLTIYWGNNWNKFTHYKGDELFSFVEYLFVPTTLFYLVQIIFIKRMKSLTWLLLTFVTVPTTFILGMFFLLISGIGGTPSQTIYIYGSIYCLTNVTATFFLLNRLKRIAKTLS